VSERVPHFAPAVHGVAIGEIDFMVTAVAKGTALNDGVDDDERLLPLLRAQGRAMATLHATPADAGFGLLDVREAALGRLVGSHDSWAGYLNTRLVEHLRVCLAIDAVSVHEAAVIERLFADVPRVNQSMLLHGDPGNHNVFAAGGEVTALIDWEDSLAGDPVYDVAFWATFHPERRHRDMLASYREAATVPDDFQRRFWVYFLRIALAKTVVRHRLGLIDKPGREPASKRIQRALREFEVVSR